MAGNEKLRSWIAERRADLSRQLIEDARRLPVDLSTWDKPLTDLARLNSLENLVTSPKTDWSNRRLGIVAVAVTSLLLILLSVPHIYAGVVSLSAQATAVRIKPATTVELGPKNLAFEGFTVFEVNGATSANDPLLREPVAVDLSKGSLRFGDKATLAIVGYDAGSELVMEAPSRDELVVSLWGHKAYVEITPNGSAIWVAGNDKRCSSDDKLHCTFPARNIRLTATGTLEIRLRRPSGAAAGGEAGIPLLRSAGRLALLTFDLKTDRAGLGTGRQSHLVQASLQLKSFGDEALQRFWGQSLAVRDFDGVADIRYAGTLRVLMNGESRAILGSGDEVLTPSWLSWLWKNKIIALYLSAALAIIGLMVDRLPKLLEWMKS